MRCTGRNNKNDTEDDIQMHIVKESLKLGYVVHGDQNRARRSLRDGMKRKLLGMRAGWPDLCYWVPRLVYIELKAWSGTQSEAQRELQDIANIQGIEYYVVKAKTKEDAWIMVQGILNEAQ
jgi:hypothetical protein